MKINKFVLIGLFGAVSVIFGLAENFIIMPVPFIRLGIANIPIMVMLYLLGGKYAFSVLLLKSFLVPLFSGNFIFKISLSFPSGLSSFVVMYIIARFFNKITTPISAGIAGAYVNMFVQIIVADIFYIRGLFNSSLSGMLLLIASVTGVLTGILTYRIVNRKSVQKLFSS